MRHLRVVPALAVLAFLTPGCAKVEVEGGITGHTSSPWEWGPMVRASYPVEVSPNTMVVPTTSYSYLAYDGGHEDRFDAGVQLRRYVGPANRPTKFWIGGEAAYAILKDHYETGSDDYDGWSLTALAGVPIAPGRFNPTLVGGAGISDYGSSGVNVRLGVSITPFR